MLAAAVSGFVPVAVTPEAPRIEGPAPRQEASTEPGVNEIVLASGVVVRSSGRVDKAVLHGVLAEDLYSGAVFCFRGRRGDLLKLLVWDGQGLVLIAKRLEKGRFVWPQATSGVVSLTPAMLSMLLEGIDWRLPAWTARPEVVG